MSKKSCFFVTPIGASGSVERKRADQMKEHVLSPVLSDKFEIIRADEVTEASDITQDIIARLYSAELVVADLTGQNPNVMYEVGIRHALNRPLISLANDVGLLPFDVSKERTIPCDTGDLDSVKDAKERLAKAVNHSISANNYRSPVARVIETEDLFQSLGNKPVSRSMLELLEDISSNVDNLQSEVASLQFTFDYQEIPDLDATAQLDEQTANRINELLRLFDRVGPSDIARLVEAIKKIG